MALSGSLPQINLGVQDNWANLKSATQIAELFDNYEDVRKVNSKPMDRWGRNDKILTYSGVKEKENRFGKTSPRLKASVPEIEILNAVQTRSQVKAAREETGIDSGDAKKGEDEVIIVSSDAEDEILIPALREFVPELALLRITRENLINAQKNSEEIKSLYEQTARQVQVTNQFVKTCDQCQRAGKPNDKKKAPLKLVPVIQEVFTKLNIDACEPLPITSKGNRYLITAICMSSKFPEAIPVSDISSVCVTDALLDIFSRMGFPREIQCDQGTSFTSALTTEFFERFGILVRHSQA
ncbi:retrovirus-related Pol polyprotein from transposon 412 [Trichonephila clavipes]|nr:retrovirus-related Pol polyprotein from transposon 412 [Trichonephila clavipes]